MSGNDAIPVYACPRVEWNNKTTPIGRASSKGEAAILIRKVLNKRLRAADVYYSEIMNAYFTSEA